MPLVNIGWRTASRPAIEALSRRIDSTFRGRSARARLGSLAISSGESGRAIASARAAPLSFIAAFSAGERRVGPRRELGVALRAARARGGPPRGRRSPCSDADCAR